MISTDMISICNHESLDSLIQKNFLEGSPVFVWAFFIWTDSLQKLNGFQY